MRGTVKLVGGRGRRRLFDNGNQVHRVRDLKDRIQVRVIAENAQGLLDGEPSVRRLFLDWNLFHVERGYADLHSAFRKILAQRNAWLRSGAHGPAIWDGAFIDLSEKISRIRNRYAEHLSVMLESLKRKHPRFPLLRVSVDRGWPSEKTLGDALSAAFGRDLQRGYTSVGPARADLQITIDGICGIGSRGQVKLAVCLIQYAAQSVVSERGAADACVWLLDDLDAELDAKTTASLWDAFLDTKEQIFVTGRDQDAANLTTHGLPQARVFHVEHGAIRD